VLAKSHERIGRPPRFNREEVLNRAMHVFWQKGFEGASLTDLTIAMGIEPASLYKAFGNKEALFEQVLTRYVAGPVAFMHDALQEPTAFAVAEQILRRTAEFSYCEAVSIWMHDDSSSFGRGSRGEAG